MGHRSISLAMVMLALVLGGGCRVGMNPVYAALAKGTYPTDIWVAVDPADGNVIRAHLNVHSISSVVCTAREVDRATDTPTKSLFFGVVQTYAGKDGTLVIDGDYPLSSLSLRHWVKVYCYYP